MLRNVLGYRGIKIVSSLFMESEETFIDKMVFFYPCELQIIMKTERVPCAIVDEKSGIVFAHPAIYDALKAGGELNSQINLEE